MFFPDDRFLTFLNLFDDYILRQKVFKKTAQNVPFCIETLEIIISNIKSETNKHVCHVSIEHRAVKIVNV